MGDLWPWRRAAGYGVSVALTVILVAAVATAVAFDVLEPSDARWLYVVAVLVAAIPIVLIVFDFMADRQGSLQILNYVSVDFRGVAAGSVRETATLAPNIIGSAAPNDSSGTEMIVALEEAITRTVIEVDLQTGSAWWPTRLLVLAAGACWDDRSHVILFVAADADVGRRIVGWTSAQDVRDRLLARDTRLRAAWFESEVDFHKQLSNPVASWPQIWETVPTGVAGLTRAFADRARERILMEKLAQLEPPEHPLSAGDVDSMLGSVLHRHSLDVASPVEEQYDVIFSSTGDYVGVTDGGVALGLVHRASLVNDIMRSLLDTPAGSGGKR